MHQGALLRLMKKSDDEETEELYLSNELQGEDGAALGVARGVTHSCNDAGFRRPWGSDRPSPGGSLRKPEGTR